MGKAIIWIVGIHLTCSQKTQKDTSGILVIHFVSHNPFTLHIVFFLCNSN